MSTPERTPLNGSFFTAVSVDATGVIFPSPLADSPASTYIVLQDGRTFLLDKQAVLVPVPHDVQSVISEQCPGRTLAFPDDASGPLTPPVVAPDLLWVDPGKVNLVYGGSALGDFLRDPNRVRTGDWDTPHRLKFSELDVYRALEHRLALGRPWPETEFYARVTRSIQAGKRKWGCSSLEEFQQRLEGIVRLYEAIRSDGYRTQEQLGTGRPNDEIRVAVRRDGRFLFLDGRHRLAIARLLELPRVPVRVIARHAHWHRLHERVDAYAAKRNGRIYQLIDHPDLDSFPAHHGVERIEIIRAALEDYEGRGKQLIDVGAHWGYMAQQMEQLGFQVTAIEANKTSARLAEEIRQATESDFTVWEGSIFDFPDVEEQDVMLALSIFHHFIKTSELHQELVMLLQRFTGDLIIFEPHLHDPPAQMRGAYRNYPPEAFARFVAELANMSSVEHLGTAPDGRSLYKITR